jgi:hypothetical protein
MKDEIETIAGTQKLQPLLLDIYAAAQRLSVAPVTVRKLIRQRRLARVPNIRKLLIPESSLRQFAATAE